MTTGLDLTTVLDEGDPVQSEDHLRLEPEPAVVREARAFVLEHAPPMSEDGYETLQLLTSELVTNAVIHARTTVDVALLTSTRCVVVTVLDLDLDLAAGQGSALPAREGGWGLGLVRSLAERSDLTRHPGGGKTAWFRLPR